MASLEERVETLTTAVERLTAVMEAGGGVVAAKAPAAGAKAPAAGAKAAKTKPKNTAEQVKAAIVNVKDTISADAAREIIEAHAGDGEKLAKLVTMPEVFDAVVAACEAALAGGGEEEVGEDDL